MERGKLSGQAGRSPYILDAGYLKSVASTMR
jgi:hypothetical protein